MVVGFRGSGLTRRYMNNYGLNIRDIPSIFLNNEWRLISRTLDRPDRGAVQSPCELADELHHTGDEWMKHLDVLMEGDQQQTWAFGRRCLELASDQMGLFDLCLNVYSSLAAKDRNPQLLRGMISHLAGTENAATILDRIAADSELRSELLIPLTIACATKVRDFERVSALVKACDLPPKSVNAFAFGSITAGFEISEFLAELTELKDLVPDAAPSVLYVVFMFCYHHQDRLERMRDLFADLVVMPRVISAIRNSEVGHAWEVCVEFLLRGPKNDFVAQLSIALTNAVMNSDMAITMFRKPSRLCSENIPRIHGLSSRRP